MAIKANRGETKPVRIGSRTHQALMELAKALDLPLTAVVDRAVDELKRQVFMAQLHDGYARLRQDPAAWSGFTQEMAEWDATLSDGLRTTD